MLPTRPCLDSGKDFSDNAVPTLPSSELVDILHTPRARLITICSVASRQTKSPTKLPSLITNIRSATPSTSGNSDETNKIAWPSLAKAFNKWNISTDYVNQMTHLPVFDPDLWIFAKEKQTNQAVGICISVYDERIRQTELEWVFVLPDHQGKNVGGMLIAETVKRTREKSNLIRVGGVADNFYMKCGFDVLIDEHLWMVWIMGNYRVLGVVK